MADNIQIIDHGRNGGEVTVLVKVWRETTELDIIMAAAKELEREIIRRGGRRW